MRTLYFQDTKKQEYSYSLTWLSIHNPVYNKIPSGQKSKLSAKHNEEIKECF